MFSPSARNSDRENNSASASVSDTGIQAFRHLLTGQVQGVGFRPFVYTLACECKLTGWVQNRVGTVEILVQGDIGKLAEFAKRLVNGPPALARIDQHTQEPIAIFECTGFSILDSATEGESQVHVPPDLFLCPDCRREMNEPEDRRFGYPFINCTQCGPRYTLIKAMPYDRCNTTMADFELCPACLAEYQDPSSRRFHAEPIACPDCGPALTWVEGEQRIEANDNACLSACVNALNAGKIVAVRGIGGYHLICNAADDEAVMRLRRAKMRPDKPLAVMFPEPLKQPLAEVEKSVTLSADERERLVSTSRPVVLAQRKTPNNLSSQIAPGLNELGVMLPYSPLHYLLLEAFGGPLVATSANISGSPVLTDPGDVEPQLSHVFDACMHHNRPIQRPADDSVFRSIHGKTRPIRLGRGHSPIEITLPFHLPEPVLATGGHMKNTIALAWENRAVISPHIGNMGNARSLKVFEQTIQDLGHLYGIEPAQVICDAHPSYVTTRWAERSGLPVHKTYHHAAHASSVVGLEASQARWLVFTWDGVGYGEDGTLWGGEALLGVPGDWQRAASFKPFRLPGGERASRELWRSAAGLCWEAGDSYDPPIQQAALLRQAWEKRLNAPVTTAAGRLFDGVAALCGFCENASFEGQGPMLMEAAARIDAVAVEFPVSRNESGVWEADWQPLLGEMLRIKDQPETASSVFHASMAALIRKQAMMIRDDTGVDHISFAGGVFQNRILTEQAITLLKNEGFTVALAERIPVNDAGISFGQIMEYGMRQ